MDGCYRYGISVNQKRFIDQTGISGKWKYYNQPWLSISRPGCC